MSKREALRWPLNIKFSFLHKGYALYSTGYHMLIFTPDYRLAILRGAVGG